MSAKKSKDKGNNKKLIIAVLAIIAVFIILYIFSGRQTKDVEVETVMIGTAEDKTQVSGFIIRDESVLTSPEAGVLSFHANEGERVARGFKVAIVYSGDVSDEVKSELSTINSHINEIEGSSVEKNLFAGGVTGGSSQIENDIDMINRAVYGGDVSNVGQYKDDIIRLIRKDTGKSEAVKTTLEKLVARRSELERSISGRATGIFSLSAGVMCSQIDGCEEYYSIKKLDEITPEYIKNSPASNPNSPDEVEKDQPCLKIINNYEWYYTAIVDEEWLMDMKKGDSVSIRFTDISNDTLSGVIYNISEPADGKCALVIKSRSMFTGMYTTRKIKAEIIRKTYKGFKVSKNAVHIDQDSNYYVYVNSEGVVRRRDVLVLYSDDAYVIIKVDNSAKNNLLLYDEVIISDKNIKEGDSV